MQTLEVLRVQIDEIDAQIKQLLDRRFDISIAVGKVKKNAGTAVLDKAREREIIASIEDDKTLKHSGEIAGVYRAIMSGSRKLQK